MRTSSDKKSERAAVDAYVAQIERIPLLSRDDELLLVRRAQAGEVKARQDLVAANLRFVVRVAHQWKGYGVALDELIQEGNEGLLLAVKRFDPARGFRFCTYAVWWIKARIRQFVMRDHSLVKIGTTGTQRRLFFKLRATQAKMHVDATPAELAAKLKADESDIVEMTQRLLGEFSIHSAVAPALADDEPLAEDELIEDQEKARLSYAVKDCLNRLSPDERFIILNRTMSESPMTLKEVGARLGGRSRERIRQVEMVALERLRRILLKRRVVTKHGELA